MFCKTHKWIVLVFGIVALAGNFYVRGTSADDKKDDKSKAALSGAWVRKEGEIKIAFDGKGAMKLFPHGEDKKLAIVFDYTVEKGKPVQVKVASFEGEEKQIEKIKELIPVGLEFSFRWTVKGETLTLRRDQGQGGCRGGT